MTENRTSNNSQTLLIVGLVTLIVVGGVLLSLWLTTRSTLQTTTIDATAAVSALEIEGTEIAAAGTEAAETAAVELDAEQAAGTEAAETAAAELDAEQIAGTEAAETAAAVLNAEQAAGTEAAETAAAELDAEQAAGIEAAETAAAVLNAEQAAGTEAAETAAAVLNTEQAAATEAAAAARRAAIDSESRILSVGADATSAANAAATAAAIATQAANDNRSTAIAVESGVLQLGANATAEARGGATVAAQGTQSAQTAATAAADAAATAAALSDENQSLRGELGNAQATIEAQANAIATLEAAPPASDGSADNDDDSAADFNAAQAAAAALNIDPNGLTLATSAASFYIDLTGEDDTIINEPLEGEYDNLVLTADITWETDATEDYCGFAFNRTDRDNYYTAEIDRDGEARFYILYQGEWSSVAGNKVSTLNTDFGDTNTLTLIVNNTDFTLFINGEVVLTASDDRLENGMATVLGGTFDESETTGCAFANIELYSFTDDVGGVDKDSPGNSDDSAAVSGSWDGIPAARTLDGAYILGDPAAPITIVEFADFRCPFCQQYRPVINAFIEQEVRSGRARFEFRMFPSVDRDGAFFRLAECAAGDDPGQFWEFHDVYYDIAEQTGRSINLAPVLLLERTGVNVRELTDCINTADQYITDQIVGQEAGVSGTPSIRVRLPDGGLLPISAEYAGGAVPLDVLSVVVAEAQ